MTKIDERAASDRVVITNVYADDNRGGAAITASAIEMARTIAPDSPITLLTVASDPKLIPQQFRFTRLLYPDVEILPAIIRLHELGPTARLRHYLQTIGYLLSPRLAAARVPAVARLREAGLVIGKGGQAFRGFRLRELGSLWFTTLPLLLACRMRRRVAVVGVSIGPFSKGRASRQLAGFVLRRLSLLIVRGPESQAAALALRVPRSIIRLAPDSVFFLPAPSPQDRIKVLTQRRLEDQKFAVATLGELPSRPDLRRKKIEVVGEILARLLDEGLVSQAVVVVQTHGKTSDLRISSDCVAHCADPRIALVEQEMSHIELIALYSGAAVTIGGRLHSTIFSLLSGTPAFPLAFFNKPHDVFSVLGLSEFVLDIRTTRPEALADRVISTLRDSPNLRQDLAALSVEMRRRLTTHVESLVSPRVSRATDVTSDRRGWPACDA
ncbi:MAG: polysaccharide pyruvyl transferase family protein [Actinomycetes bacterium]